MTGYQDAVNFAFAALDRIETFPSEADRLAALLLHYFENQDKSGLNSIFRASESQALAFDALSRASAVLVEKGEPLPPRLALWASHRLLDKVKRPKIPNRFKRGWPGEHKERDEFIYILVIKLRDYGISPTRNDAQGSWGESGCDAVAEAMAQRGLTPNTFKGIKKIYTRMNAKYAGGGMPDLGVALTSQMVKDMLRK